MKALRIFQNCYACCAQSVARGTGGGCEELSVDRACAQSVISAWWACMHFPCTAHGHSWAVSSSPFHCPCPLSKSLSHQGPVIMDSEVTWALLYLQDHGQGAFLKRLA